MGTQPYGWHGQWQPEPRPPARRPKPWLWLLPLLVLVVATAVVVPLVVADGDEASREGGGAPAMPEETRTPRPEQRDPDAVTVALRQLDPCKVHDLAVAKKRQRPNVVLIPTGPHSCFLAPSAEVNPLAGGGIDLVIGTLSDQFFRYDGRPVVVGGAKAYEYARVDDLESSCRVVLPVSETMGIELEYREPGEADLCPTVHQYAEGAVGKLRDPDALAYTDTSRSFSAWDGCSLVRAALGEAEADSFDYEPNSHGDRFAGCNAVIKDRSNGLERVSLEVSYDDDAEVLGDARTIAGKTVAVRDRGKECKARWNHGPSGTKYPLYAITPVSLSAKDCDTVVALAEKVITLAGRKPADDVAPQRPLLYGSDENDTASLGACVDLAISGGVEDCEPYQEVPVPQGTDTIMAASDENRNLQCAVFSDAVAAEFGDQFVPVTWEAHCFFVDEEHTVQIQVNVDSGNAPIGYGTHTGLYTDREKTEIAGKPAVTFWDTDRRTFEIYLSPHDDINAAGNLHMAVEMIGGRGGEHATPPSLPRDKADLATAAMTQVVERYFR